MPEAFHDDESFDEEEPGPLLPPDDRLWRHPSEMSSAGPSEADVSAARDRWLSRTPTRAGAWSAGFVGAVLATGVVLIGTHLNDWLGRPARPSTIHAVTTTMVGPESPISQPALEKIASRVREGLAVVQVSVKGHSLRGDGILMGSGGNILVPLSLVAGAATITATMADGSIYVARLVGTDAATQLAVLNVSDMETKYEPVAFSPASDIHRGDLLALEWSRVTSSSDPPSMRFSIASVSSSAAASAGGSYDILDSLRLQAGGLSDAPVGTVLVNGSAQLLGIVTMRRGDHLLATPGSLASAVGREISEHGRVTHGWLGIVGESTQPLSREVTRVTSNVATPQTSASGVEVVSVQAGGAAAKAGLHVGDVIEAINGDAVDGISQLQQALYVLRPGSDVKLTVQRGTSVRTLEAQLQPAA